MINIRKAEKSDIPTIFNLIKGLAKYEKLEHEVEANEEKLSRTIFEESYAEVFIGEYNGKAVGFSLFFHNYSTFLAKPGIYLEDLYVIPEYRGKGVGKALLVNLAKVAVDKNCGRFEWSVLDWNKPAIEFYKSLGALPMEGWTTNRVTGDALINLANGK